MTRATKFIGHASKTLKTAPNFNDRVDAYKHTRRLAIVACGRFLVKPGICGQVSVSMIDFSFLMRVDEPHDVTNKNPIATEKTIAYTVGVHYISERRTLIDTTKHTQTNTQKQGVTP